jgi:hypothetical protein
MCVRDFLASFSGVAAAAAFSGLLTGAVYACAAAVLAGFLFELPVFGPFVSVHVHLFALVCLVFLINKLFQKKKNTR